MLDPISEGSAAMTREEFKENPDENYDDYEDYMKSAITAYLFRTSLKQGARFGPANEQRTPKKKRLMEQRTEPTPHQLRMLDYVFMVRSPKKYSEFSSELDHDD